MSAPAGPSPDEFPSGTDAAAPLSTDRFALGEGLRLLDDGTVVLVDILTGRLFRVTSDGPGEQLVQLAHCAEPLGAVAPLPPAEVGGSGRWLAALGTGFAVLDGATAGTGGTRWLARPAAGAGPERRMNDAVCDPAGRMWGGSMAYDNTEGAGSLYRLEVDGTVTEAVTGLTVPNGPAFSPDGRTMYLADSPKGVIDAWTVDPGTGELTERRPFVRLSAQEGHPDGMVTDAHGRLWCAVWGGAQVRCFSPDGELLETVPLPVRQPTSVCLTGDRLLVTSAATGLAQPGPEDGAVLQLPCTAPPVATPTAGLRT